MALADLISVLNDAPATLRLTSRVPGAHLVGGFLRDAYLGTIGKDFDLAVSGSVEQAADRLAELTGGSAFELGPKFSTWRVVCDECEFDVSPLHADGITADLAQRDFTINAMAVDCRLLGNIDSDKDIQHLPHSFSDLDSRILRQVSPENLEQDPARLLRSYRIAAKASLEIESETRNTLRALAPKINDCAAERLHEELMIWMSADTPLLDTLRFCAEDGVLWELFPELKQSDGCIQNDYHHLDVWTHTLLALEQLDQLRVKLPEELKSFESGITQSLEEKVSGVCNGLGITRLALLLHDIGKPATRDTQPDGRISFHGHQETGVDLALPSLQRLKTAKHETELISLMIREHLRLGFYSGPDEPVAKLIHRFIRRLGKATPLMVLHSLADCLATRGLLSKDGFSEHLRAARVILHHYFAEDRVAKPPVLLDGNEIITELGLTPGPKIGEIKAALEEATATGVVSNRDEALIYIRRFNELP